MGRVIHLENIGRKRLHLQRSVVLALRELMRQQEPNKKTRDLAAYISLALEEISETVETTVTAWEKRDYWLKADRFRMDWAWTGKLSHALRVAIQSDNWVQVASLAAQVGERLKDIELPVRHRLGEPWQGAWEKLQSLPTKR